MAVAIYFGIFIFASLTISTSCTHSEGNSSRLACPPNENFQQPLNRINTAKKLAAIRKLMELRNGEFDAILVTFGDGHQNEVISNDDKRIEYISGFSGSNADVIITMDQALLWTDSRYHLQADEELDCNWCLMRDGNEHVPSKSKWLQKQFPFGCKIGADSKLVPANVWTKLDTELKEQNKNFSLVEIQNNLIDELWVKPHPEHIHQAYTLDYYYTGKSWTTKVSETLQELKKLKSQAMVITAVDEIAWLLNIRGWDYPYSGFLKSYVFLSANDTILYVDKRKIEGNITHFFENYFPGQLKFKNYEQIFNDLPLYSQKWSTILVPSFCGYSPGASRKIFSLVPKDKLVSKPSPIIYLKARKNPTEVVGMIKAHIRDGAALCKFFQYFESSISQGDTWDELKVAKEVDRLRLEQPLSVVPSFPTIAAFGPHGAHPHYIATPSTSSIVYNNSTLLIDSGGQYYDGTTDITRTVHLGNPTQEQKEAYTSVLIGSIELSNLIFPDNLGTSGMDVIARAPIWQAGYNYGHGTSHGIGSFLNVHESPISMNYNKFASSEQLQAGHFLSNEPGIYIDKNFGIRLENIMRVVNETSLKEQNGHFFLGFREVTLVPYDNKLIDFELLDVKHKRWLNQYNAKIRKLVGEELKNQNETDAYNWMWNNTRPIISD